MGDVNGWTVQKWLIQTDPDTVWCVNSFELKAQCDKFVTLDSALYHCFIILPQNVHFPLHHFDNAAPFQLLWDILLRFLLLYMIFVRRSVNVLCGCEGVCC